VKDIIKIDDIIITILKISNILNIPLNYIDNALNKDSVKILKLNDTNISLLYRHNLNRISNEFDSIYFNSAYQFTKKIDSKYYPYIKKKFGIKYVAGSFLLDKSKLNNTSIHTLLFNFYNTGFLIITDKKVFAINKIKYGL
jgi:hypothetical protein